MRRNVVAIIGSAGEIPHELRRTVETLACALAGAGFDLVTGSMDGVMRAVARGHARSAAATHLVHIEPGWGRPMVARGMESRPRGRDAPSVRGSPAIGRSIVRRHGDEDGLAMITMSVRTAGSFFP